MIRARRVVLTSLLFLLSTTAFIGAQTAQDAWYVDKPVKAFTFKGLVTVKEADLQSLLAPHIGEKFSTTLLEDVQASLYALDYFESIVTNAVPGDDAKSSLTIEFVVKERPAIVEIVVKGNATVRTNEITDKILLKKGDLANQSKLDADVAAVKSLYLDKGYADANVTGSFDAVEADTTVRATFTITEGIPTTIKDIHFSGNTFASESTLRGVMKTKPQSLFDSGVFEESKLEEDKAAIISYYTDRGYVDVTVDKITRDIENQNGRNFLNITIYVTEGQQWNYGGMSFVGNNIFSSERLQELVYQKSGKPLSAQKLQADIDRIRSLYYDNGYIFNAFAKSEKRDDTIKTITYTLTIQETDKAHIESIIFKGNTRTKEKVLRRGLPFEEGDVFNVAQIVQGRQYLENLQFFKSVSIDTPAGSENGLMDIVFTVEEQSTADINFGVVFSGGSYPISGDIKWNEKNFQGGGQTVSVDLEFSSIKQLIALSYAEPFLTDVPWSGGLSLSFDHQTQTDVLQDILGPVFSDSQQSIAAPDPYTNRTDYLTDLSNGISIPTQYLMSYDSYDIGLGANTGYTFTLPGSRLGVQASYTPTIRYVDYDATLYRPFEANVRDNNMKWIFIDQIAASVVLDGRDIYWNPTKGYYAAQNFTYVGGFLFGDREYIRTDSTVEGFLTLFDLPVFEGWDFQVVLAAHSALSFILPNYDPASNSWKTNTDYTDQLYIDGMTVGRGWREMYGNALWDNKVELRMPIVKEAVWFVTFLDIAGLWDQPWYGAPPSATDPTTSFNNMSLDQFYFSVGAGLRFSIPQFPIRLYLAQGFKYNSTSGTWSLKTGDFSVGSLSLNFVISLGGNVF
jgi:outer membrane protein insertion porin family